MGTSTFPEAAGQQDDKEAAAGLDTEDEEAPLSPSAISPSSRTTEGTGVNTGEDAGTDDGTVTDETGTDTADDTAVDGTVVVDED